MREVVNAQNVRARVCHLTTAHRADDIRIFRKQCVSLATAGFDVFLVAPGAKDAQLDGVTVRGVPRSRGRMGRFLVTLPRVTLAALHTRARVFHIHDPDLLLAVPILRVFGAVIYDVHECVPEDILDKQYIPRPIRRVIALLVGGLERIVARGCRAVITATKAIASRFPKDRIVVVQNFPLEHEIVHDDSGDYAARKNTVIYAGGISALRGAHQMVHAVGKLAPSLNATLQLAGPFAEERLQDELSRSESWSRVCYRGVIARSELQDALRSSRLGLVLFHPIPNHINAQPNKLFEYMAAGLPVVASDFPLWREIVDGAQCGICVNPLDDVAIIRALEYILKNPLEASQMGKNGLLAVRRQYTWRNEAQKLTSLYAEIIH